LLGGQEYATRFSPETGFLFYGEEKQNETLPGGNSMSTTINDAVQNLNVLKKEFKKPDKTVPEKQQVDRETSQANEEEQNKDTILVQISSHGISGTKAESHAISSEQEAHQLLSDVIGEVSSEDRRSLMNRIHNLSPGSVIDLLA
jgi:hypothetical protein